MHSDSEEEYLDCVDGPDDAGVVLEEAVRQAEAWGMDNDLDHDPGYDSENGSVRPFTSTTIFAVAVHSKTELEQLQQPWDCGAGTKRTTATEETFHEDACRRFRIEKTSRSGWVC